MGKTILAKITDSKIKQIRDQMTISRINDSSSELQFHFKSQRDQGAWHIVTTIMGQPISKKIGNYPSIKTQQIRQMLPAKLAALTNNVNAQISEPEFNTMGQLLDWYVDRSAQIKLSPDRMRCIQSTVKCQLLPIVADWQINDVNDQRVDQQLLLPLIQKYAISSVKLAFGILKTACRLAHRLGLLPQNVMASMQFSGFQLGQIKPKPAMVAMNDLSWILRQVCGLDLPQLFALVILLHGTRIGETRQAKWRHIDLSNRIWRIPATDTKTKVELELPLTVLSHAIFERLATCNKGVNVFGELSAVQANQLIQTVSERRWTAHDLRKLMRTACERLTGQTAVCELLINHTLGKMQATYLDQRQLMPNKLAVLRAYHDWLLSDPAFAKLGIMTRSLDEMKRAKAS